MKEIKIVLDGKEYVQRGVKARVMREALVMNDENSREDISEVKKVDNMVSFVAGIFSESKLTADDIWDGLESSELIGELTRVMNEVMGVDTEEEDPKTQENA